MTTISIGSWAAVLLCAVTTEATTKIGPARLENGFCVHPVESSYQSARTELRVLLPGQMEPARRYPVVYVLPVEAGRENRYGDGLLEIKKHDLHNHHQAIFVAPTFAQLPWYADHPTNSKLQQESYFLQAVLPFIEKTYPAEAKPAGRLLLGFSKSGWGAFSLLLRHPDIFGRAAAWDAPLMMDGLGKYGTTEIFATQENFDRYRIDLLLRAKAAALGREERLFLTGIGNFGPHHEQAHALLNELKIPHGYSAGEPRQHDWHSGWVSEAVRQLLAGEGK